MSRRDGLRKSEDRLQPKALSLPHPAERLRSDGAFLDPRVVARCIAHPGQAALVLLELLMQSSVSGCRGKVMWEW